jgi:hypothetical protein
MYKRYVYLSDKVNEKNLLAMYCYKTSKTTLKNLEVFIFYIKCDIIYT